MRPWSRPSPLLRRLAAPHRHFDIHRKINFAQKYPPLLCCCLTRQHLFRRILKNSIQYYYYLHQQRKSFFYTLRRCVGCLFGCNFFLQATNTLIITHNICMDVSVNALKSAKISINLNPLTWTLVRLTAQNLTENWPHFCMPNSFIQLFFHFLPTMHGKQNGGGQWLCVLIKSVLVNSIILF